MLARALLLFSVLAALLNANPATATDAPKLKIHVSDAESKLPVPAAHVRVTWRNDVAPAFVAREDLIKQEDNVEADAAGAVVIEIPEPFRSHASAYVVAMPRGYQPSGKWGQRSTDVVVTSGGDASIEIAVKKGLVLSGLVVDTDARPIAGARILMTLSGPSWCSWPPFYPSDPKTDEHGRWEITSFNLEAPIQREGSRYVITIQHPSHAPAVIQTPDQLPSRDGVIELKTVMNPSVWVEGTVLDPNRTPVAGARVMASGPAKPDEPVCVSIHSEAVADERGWFRLGGLDDRKLSLGAEHDAHAPSPAVEAASPQALPSPLQLALTPGHALEGKVARANGAPVAGLNIRLSERASGLYRQNTTDDRGTFRFTGLPAGTVTLTGEDVFSQEVEIPHDQPLAITTPRRRVLRVKLVNADDGTPIEPPARLYYRGPYYSSGTELDSTDGVIELRNLAPGTWRFVAVKAGRVVTQAGVRLLDNGKQDSEQVIELHRGFSLKGRVTDLEGNPIEGAVVSAGGPIPQDERETKTDADGRYELVGLNRRHVWAGSWYLLSAEKDGFASVIDPELFARSWPFDRRANFELGPGATIEGRVLTKDGQPAVGVLVQVMKGSRWYRAPTKAMSRTDDQGRFELTRVPADSVRLYAGDQLQELRLHHGETKTLEIKLP